MALRRQHRRFVFAAFGLQARYESEIRRTKRNSLQSCRVSQVVNGTPSYADRGWKEGVFRCKHPSPRKKHRNHVKSPQINKHMTEPTVAYLRPCGHGRCSGWLFVSIVDVVPDGTMMLFMVLMVWCRWLVECKTE
jgi:hypothetical protein